MPGRIKPDGKCEQRDDDKNVLENDDERLVIRRAHG